MKGFKTIAFAAMVAVMGILELIDPDVLSTAFGLGDQGRSIVIIGVGVVMAVLRAATSTPLGKKQ